MRRLEPRKSKRRRVDLRRYFPDVGDQQTLNSATAQACVDLIEYFQRRAFGKVRPGSVRFVYKLMRKLLGRMGDSGGDLRTAFKAIVRFGIPPASLCPYSVERFDEEPEPFLYSYAHEFHSIAYVRLDRPNTDGQQTLKSIKSFVTAGFPCVFGFAIPDSLTTEADIPWQPLQDGVRGGQAAIIVGYDDDRLRSTKGALLIRSSWGAQWGEAGYGWLPYRFVEQQMAVDCWTALKKPWLVSKEFRKPVLDES